MTNKILSFALLCLLSLTIYAGRLEDDRADSLRICQLLADGAKQPKGANLMLYFGHQFMGTPYVGGTLDCNPTEQLVINTREMDCTTFVETVVALTITTQKGQRTFAAYKQNLQTLRYAGGKLNGYASRNHYFSQWIANGERLGLVHEINGPAFTAQQQLRLNYMSSHPSAYAMLRSDLPMQRQIARMERAASGRTVRYIPVSALGGKAAELPEVRDGDILCLVTRKAGLDVAHIGIAEWGRDGYLHLLNASSLQKRVILDTQTLQQYMRKQSTQLGIRVVRVVK